MPKGAPSVSRAAAGAPDAEARRAFGGTASPEGRGTVGRSREADLQLPDPSVSRTHARVYRVGHRYFLADLGSRNGTQANGKPVTQLPLDDGQTFQIGPYRIHFLASDAAPSSGEEPTVPLPSGEAVPPKARRAPASGAPAAARETEGAPFGMVGGSPSVR
ncbi:MAG: FHA domain-containing protein, partial [Verrucomicrobiota bacterium]